MKHLFYTIIALFLMASCQQEELPSVEGVGYLSLENIQIQAAEVTSVQTKAVDEDLYVEIEGSDGKTITYNPGSVPSSIELEPGSYTLKVYNKAYEDEDYTQAVYYYKTGPFQIKEGEVNHQSVKVPMINFGISLKLPEGFSTPFPTNSFSVTSGEKTQTLEGQGTVYFRYSNNVSVSYTLSATNKDGEDKESEGSSADWGEITIESGHIYVITYHYATQSLSLQE